MLQRKMFLTSLRLGLEFVFAAAHHAPPKQITKLNLIQGDPNVRDTRTDPSLDQGEHGSHPVACDETSFAAFEKFARPERQLPSRAAFEDFHRQRPAPLAGAKDVQELVNLQSTFAQPTIEKAIAYSKSVYEVATQTNTEFTKATERRVTEWNENFVSLLDKAAKNAPAGSDVAVSAVKQMLAAAKLGLRQLQQG